MPDRNELIASLKGRIWGGEIHKGGYIHVPQEEAETILELLKAQEPVKDWISVKDRLPKENGEYLISTMDRVTSAYYERGRRVSEWTDYFEGYIDFEPTHWMPLPEPPKKRKGE